MKRAAALVAGLLLFGASPVAAQVGPSLPEDDVTADESFAAELNVDAIDLDDHPNVSMIINAPRELIGLDLNAESFTVLENGDSRPIVAEKLPTSNLEVVLVLDLSGSMRGEPIEAARSAVATFLSQMPTGVQVAAIGFGNEATVLNDFTSDMAEVGFAVAAAQAGGETALYDGLVAAVDLFRSASESRRSVVLLSDGGDTVSTRGLEEAVIAVLNAGVDFYAIPLQSPEADLEPLERLEQATNGRLVPADDPVALADSFNEIAADLVNQYLLTYHSIAYGPTDLVISLQRGDVAAGTTRRLQFPQPPPIIPDVEPAPEPDPITGEIPVRPVPTTTAKTLPPLREGFVLEPGFFSKAWMVAAGAGAVFAGLAVALGTAILGRVSGHRIRRRKKGPGKDTKLSELANRASLFAEQALESRGKTGRLNDALEQAGLLVRPGEFLVLAFSLAFISFAAGYLVSGLLLGAGLGLLVAAGVRSSLSIRALRRKKAFSEQLGDVLQLIGGGIRAGYGLLQAIDAVASEAISPSSDELRRIVTETNLGRDLVDALKAMAHRVDSEDFQWVVEAIQIHREVGGDLAQILDSVAATIRDRDQIRRRIQSLSAEGRMSASVLLGLPFFVGGVVAVTNPSYLAELTTTPPGRFMIVGGLVLMAMGTVWMRRVTRLKY